MKNILYGQIRPPNPTFTPAPAYGDEEFQDPNDTGPVEGEVALDFGDLGAGDGPLEIKPKAAEPKPEPVIEIPEPKPEPEKKPEPKAEEKKPKPEEKKPDPAKPEPKKEEAEKPLPTEEEVDAMKPRANAPARDVKSFGEMKDVIKRSVSEVKRLTAEIETLKKAPAQGLTPEIEARLKQADEDRKLAEAFQLENDPIIRKEHTEKLSKAEGDFFTFLKDDPNIGLPEKGNNFSIEKLKALGLDTPAGRAEVNRMIAKVRETTGDEILCDEIKAKFKERANVIAAHNQRIEGLRGGGDALLKARQEKEAQEHDKWSAAARANVSEIFNSDKEAYGHIAGKEIPEGATAAEKAEIEAHNKEVTEKIIPAFQAKIVAIMNKDPKEGMKVVLDATRVPVLLKKLAASEESAKKAAERIAELEGDAGRVRKVSTATRESAPPVKGARDDGREVSAIEAADAWAAERGIK